VHLQIGKRPECQVWKMCVIVWAEKGVWACCALQRCGKCGRSTHASAFWQCLSLKLSGRLQITIPFLLQTLLVPKSMSRLRADIQALRAIAVLLVIAYHISPRDGVKGQGLGRRLRDR
jgi:hypothetical protein